MATLLRFARLGLQGQEFNFRKKVNLRNYFDPLMGMFRFLILTLVLISVSGTSYGQFQLNGSANLVAPNCYQLTSNINTDTGAIWGVNGVDLSEPFNVYFNFNFGANNSGGDGIAFVLQQTSSTQLGGQLGYSGINPSFIVEFDTYQDSIHSDSAFDHIGIFSDGVSNHTSLNNLVPQVQMSSTQTNVKDGNFHSVQITWDPTANQLDVYFDCVLRTSYIGNIPANFFTGNSVFWGLTSSTDTGSITNAHQVCIEYTTFLDGLEDETICPGDTVFADAGTGTGYLWTPNTDIDNNTIQTPKLYPSVSQTYFVDVTDNCGNIRTDSIDVQVVDSLSAVISGDTAICPGVSVPLSFELVGPTPMVVEIFDGFTTTTVTLDSNGNDVNTGTAVFVTPLATSTYTINQIANGIACVDFIGGSATITVVDFSAITTSSTDALCNGSCDGTGTINVPVGSGFTLLWPDGSTGNFNGNLCAGTVVVTVDAGGGCTGTVQVVVNEPLPITMLTIPPDTICLGTSQNLTINASGGVGGYVYKWTLLNDTNTLVNTQTFSAGPDTSTIYTASVTDANNCPVVTQNVTIFVRDSLTANITASSIGVCAGDLVQLTGNATGGDGNYNYNWAWGSGASVGQLLNDNPTVTTTYVLNVSDACGTTPTALDSFTVIVDPIPSTSFTISDTMVCPGAPVEFGIEFYNPNFTYIANFGDGNSDTIKNGVGSYAYTNSGNCFDVSMTVITNFCNTTTIDTCAMTIYPKPTSDFNFLPLGEEGLTNLSPEVEFVQQAFDATGYNWYVDSVWVSDDPIFTYAFPDSGTFTVELEAINEFTCTDTIQYPIVVGYDFGTFYIPNAFSPNGDGINEEFGPKANIFFAKNYRFRIFDRWGDRIFETTDLNTFWNGKLHNTGEDLPDGVYVYFIEFRNFEGEPQEYFGHLLLFH